MYYVAVPNKVTSLNWLDILFVCSTNDITHTPYFHGTTLILVSAITHTTHHSLFMWSKQHLRATLALAAQLCPSPWEIQNRLKARLPVYTKRWRGVSVISVLIFLSLCIVTSHASLNCYFLQRLMWITVREAGSVVCKSRNDAPSVRVSLTASSLLLERDKCCPARMRRPKPWPPPTKKKKRHRVEEEMSTLPIKFPQKSTWRRPSKVDYIASFQCVLSSDKCPCYAWSQCKHKQVT